MAISHPSRTSPGAIGVTASSVTSSGNVTVEDSISIKEKADANADVAAYGQIWVNTATPCELYFTDDAGTDVQLGAGGGTASDNESLILHMQVFA